MEKAVLTVIGKDRTGIIHGVSGVLLNADINILDISQTIMQDMFTMVMLVDIANSNVEFSALKETLTAEGQRLGVEITICHEQIFNSMHRI